MPRRVCAEDEWGKTEVSRGTAEDDPILGAPGCQKESNVSMKATPKKPPKGDASRMGPTWGYGANWFRVNTSPPH